MQYTERCVNVLLRTNTGGGRTALSGCQLSQHTFHIYKGGGVGKKTFKFQCLHPPLPSSPLPSSLSPSPFPSSWLLRWWTGQQWKPGYVNRGGIQRDCNTLRCASAPQAGEQREISARSVLGAGVNKINSLPTHCSILETNTSPSKQINGTDETKKNAMNADWVQPHRQESKFPNLEINHYY